MLVEQCGCPIEGLNKLIEYFLYLKDYLGEDINGCTALFYAITLNHFDACQTLLDLDANPNHKDTRGRTYVLFE
jgi:ankyrin repeat protein